MEYTIETPSAVERKIIFNLEVADVNTYIDKAIKSLSKEVSLNGFRKGKIPASVIESRFAQDVQSRATDSLVNTTIQSCLVENDVNPISRIKFVEIENNENKEVKRNSPHTFAVSFEVLPEMELPVLEELVVNQLQPEVTPEDIEEFMKRVRQTGATLAPVTEDRTPQEGDICLIDVEGTFEGGPVPGMKGENIHIQFKKEANQQTIAIEEILGTLKAGEEKDGKMVIAEEYPDPSFRNQEIDIHVKLHSISLEELPVLDDEFVTKLGFTDLQQLNAFALDSIASQQQQKIKTEAQNKLLDDLLEKLDIALPPSLVEAHKNEYLMEARNFLMQQGQDPQQMTESIARMQEDADREAAKQAKAQTFLLAIAFREKVTISEQEMQDYVVRAAKESGQDPQELMDRLYQSGVVNDIQERLMAAKALEVMYAKAVKNLVDKDGNPVEKVEVSETEA